MNVSLDRNIRYLHITRIQNRSAKYFAKFLSRNTVLVDNHNECLKGITQLANVRFVLPPLLASNKRVLFPIIYFIFSNFACSLIYSMEDVT